MGKKNAPQDDEYARKRQSLILKDVSHLSPEDVSAQFTNQVHRLHRAGPPISAAERTAINDEISIWMVKIIKYLKARAFKNDELQILESLEYVFQTVVDYLGSDRGPADTANITNALNSSLTNLLTKILTYVGALSVGKETMRRWLEERVIYKLSRSSKNLYYFIETFLKHGMEATWLMEGETSFLVSTIGTLNSNGNNPLANSMSRAVVGLFKKKFTTRNDDEVRNWISSWIKYIPEDLLNDSDIIKYLIPQFLKVTDRTFPIFMSEVSQRNYSSRSQLAFRCAAQNLRLDTTVPSELSPKMAQEWFTDIDPEVRLLAFKYVTGSAKALTPIQELVYCLIQESLIIQSFMNEFENLEDRNLFCSALNLFIKRIKDSLFVLSKQKIRPQEIDEGISFIDWLLQTIIPHYLLPSSTYPQLSTALTILSSIINCDFSSSLNPYREEIARMLYLNLSNNYENVRQEAYKILLQYPKDSLTKALKNQIQELLQGDLNKLSDIRGRRSEAFANLYSFATEYLLVIEPDSQSFGNFFDKVKSAFTDLQNNRVHGLLTYLKLAILFHNDLIDTFLKDNIVEWNITLWNTFQHSLAEISNSNNEEFENDITTIYHWKVIKEANALLSQFAISSKLEYCQLESAMNLIASQLENIKHRGVFLSVYPSFITIASLYFSHENSKLENNDPLIYLDKCLRQIINKSQVKSRRSAGLPYVISGILSLLDSSFTKTPRVEMCKQCFERLFEIARRPFSYDGKNDLPQVHAFNILKQLYSESQIPSYLLDMHLTQALDLCLEFFTSTNWSVRNCAVMLFGVIQRHLFSSGKKLSSVVIFNRFADIQSILLKHSNTEKAFPVVSILSNVVNSSNDNTLSPLVDFLMTALGHAHWKIRKMAARALANVLSPNQLNSFLDSSLDGQLQSENQFHGIMLTNYEIIIRIKTELYGHAMSQRFSLELITFFATLLKSKNEIQIIPHWAILEAIVKILNILDFTDGEGFALFERSVEMLLTENLSIKLDGLKEAYLATLVGVLLQSYLKQKKWGKIENLSFLSISNSGYPRVSEVAIEFNTRHNETIEYSKNYIQQLATLLQSEKMSDYIQCQFVDYIALVVSKYGFNIEVAPENLTRLTDGLKCRLLHLRSIISSSTMDDEMVVIEHYLSSDSPEELRILAAKTIAQLISKEGAAERLRSIIFDLLTDEEVEIRQIACQSFQNYCGLSFVPNSTYLMKILREYDFTWNWDYFLSKDKIDFWAKEAHNSFELSTVFDFEPANIYRNELDNMVMVSKLHGYKGREFQSQVMGQLIAQYGGSAIREPAVFVLAALSHLVSEQPLDVGSFREAEILASSINQAFNLKCG